MNEFDTPVKCLLCGKQLDAAQCVNGAIPLTAGNIVVCAYCGAVAVYADDLTLRAFTGPEMEALLADTETLLALAHTQRRLQFIREKRAMRN